MSDKKKEADRLRIKLKRINESLEEKENRLEHAREYKKTPAGKKAKKKQDAKRNARRTESLTKCEEQSVYLENRRPGQIARG